MTAEEGRSNVLSHDGKRKTYIYYIAQTEPSQGKAAEFFTLTSAGVAERNGIYTNT